jgi:hypothetical protein
MALAMTTSDPVGVHPRPPARAAWWQRQYDEHSTEIIGYVMVGFVTAALKLVVG